MAIFGAKLFKRNSNGSFYENDAIGKNSEAVTQGDLLTVASGLLSVSGATTTVVGVAAKTFTYASDNQTVAKLAPLYTPIYQDDLFLMGTNADLTGNATNAGTYYGITGATNAQVVDVTTGVTTGASRVVEIVEVDPRGKGGTGAGSGLRECLVRIVKTPYLNVTITA